MHNEHHSSHTAQGFGKNTNGAGILIVAAVFTVIGLFTWWLWNNNHKEFDHYRIEGAAAAQGTEGHSEEHGAAKPLGVVDSLTGDFIYNVGDEMEIVLPDNDKTKLLVGKNSTEAKLYNFLSNDDNKVDTVDKTKGWITCDRIFFETGKANLTEASSAQIGRLSSILKAYPKAEIKVGGYTDTTGGADINTKLSAERALTIAKQLEGFTGRAKIVSEGYGPLHPLADNSTPEGRAMNRRVDIRVIKK